ncbi:helix-turn-helix transcriptional regulator [Devosia sp. CAU 1758]
MADWLFSSGNCAMSYDFAEMEQVRFRRGAVRAYLAETPILPGIWLYRGEANGQSQFGIGVEGGGAEGGRLILGSMLASRGLVNMEGCDDQHWRDDGRFYVLSPTERRVRYEIDAERGWRLVAIRLEARALDLLGSDGVIPDVARQVLEGTRDDLSDMAPLPSALRSLGHTLLRSPYEGPMQTLFRQSKVLEMLAHQFSAFGGVNEGQRLNARELVKVRAARDRLLSDLRDPPDLETLAREVGLAAKRLNRGFRELYGTTVFTYLRDARLDAARRALEAGTPLPLKQLAWELGYGQVSNFVTAFRRRFGVTPGSYRVESEHDYARRE